MYFTKGSWQVGILGRIYDLIPAFINPFSLVLLFLNIFPFNRTRRGLLFVFDFNVFSVKSSS